MFADSSQTSPRPNLPRWLVSVRMGSAVAVLLLVLTTGWFVFQHFQARAKVADGPIVCREAIWEFGELGQEKPEHLHHVFKLENRELVVTLGGEDVVVGAGPSDQYLDPDGPCIYVDGNAGRLIRSFASNAINSALGEHRLRDLSPLAEILDCEPGEVDQTPTRLRINPVDEEGAFGRPEDDAEVGADPDDQGEGRIDAAGPDGESGLAAPEETAADGDGTGAGEGGSHASIHAADAATAACPPTRSRTRTRARGRAGRAA